MQQKKHEKGKKEEETVDRMIAAGTPVGWAGRRGQIVVAAAAECGPRRRNVKKSLQRRQTQQTQRWGLGVVNGKFNTRRGEWEVGGEGRKRGKLSQGRNGKLGGRGSPWSRPP